MCVYIRIYIYIFASQVKLFLPQGRMAAFVGDGFQIRRVTLNIVSRESQVAEKGWSLAGDWARC